jgi:hypothetical protein
MMSEIELDALADDCIKLAFEYFDKVSEESSSKDNGNTSRIMDYVEEILSDSK